LSIHATALCKASEKRLNNYIRTEYDKDMYKWCNLCESIKTTKDGLCANCKSCKSNQKKEYIKKKLNNKSESV
jgi:hypothetical protein